MTNASSSSGVWPRLRPYSILAGTLCGALAFRALTELPSLYSQRWHLRLAVGMAALWWLAPLLPTLILPLIVLAPLMVPLGAGVPQASAAIAVAGPMAMLAIPVTARRAGALALALAATSIVVPQVTLLLPLLPVALGLIYRRGGAAYASVVILLGLVLLSGLTGAELAGVPALDQPTSLIEYAQGNANDVYGVQPEELNRIWYETAHLFGQALKRELGVTVLAFLFFGPESIRGLFVLTMAVYAPVVLITLQEMIERIAASPFILVQIATWAAVALAVDRLADGKQSRRRLPLILAAGVFLAGASHVLLPLIFTGTVKAPGQVVLSTITSSALAFGLGLAIQDRRKADAPATEDHPHESLGPAEVGGAQALARD